MSGTSSSARRYAASASRSSLRWWCRTAIWKCSRARFTEVESGAVVVGVIQMWVCRAGARASEPDSAPTAFVRSDALRRSLARAMCAVQTQPLCQSASRYGATTCVKNTEPQVATNRQDSPRRDLGLPAEVADRADRRALRLHRERHARSVGAVREHGLLAAAALHVDEEGALQVR